MAHDADEMSLRFDPAACVGCRRCADVCPEKKAGAIAVTPRLDTEVLAEGVQTLSCEPIQKCPRCGRPVASEAMVGRVAAILKERPAWMDRCKDCRGLEVTA